MFTVVPIPVRIMAVYVDGALALEYGEKRTVELDVTTDHELVFKSPCCYDKTLTIGPSNVPVGNRIRVPFQGKPANIVFKTDPPSKGRVGIYERDPEGGERFETAANLGEPVHIRFGSDRDMAKTLILTLDIEGRGVENHEVLVRAGETGPKVVKLAP